MDRSVVVSLQVRNAQFLAGMAQSSAATRKLGSQVGDFTRQHEAGMARAGTAAVAMGAALATGAALSVRAAVDWESAWAGVTKTTEGNAKQMAVLEGELRQLAKTLPASHREIAAVAEAAGQLGVKREAIAGFTKVMIDLGETTNVTADEAATSIAQIANVMGTKSSEIDNFASTLVALGNAGASTERDILQMAARLAGAGKLIGASEADVLALANAMASMGIDAELGGGAMSRAILSIYGAVQGGSEKLTRFAEIAGTSAEDFAASFRSDPIRAVDAFVQGLNRIDESGGNVMKALGDLGIEGTQDLQVLLRLKGAGDLLSDSLDNGAAAWKANTALAIEAGKRYETTEAKMQVAKNTVNDLAIDLGDTLLPMLAASASGLSDFAGWLSSLPDPVKSAASTLGALAAVLSLAGGAALIAVPKVLAMKASLDALGISATRSSGLLLSIGKAAGIVGIALSASAFASGVFDKWVGSVSVGGKKAADTLLQIGASGQATKDDMKALGAGGYELDKMFDGVFNRGKLDNVVGFFGNISEALLPFNSGDEVDAAGEAFKSIDDGLMSLLSSGHTEQAAEAFAVIKEQADAQGVSVKQLAEVFPQYAEAVGAAATEQDAALASSRDLADAVSGVDSSVSNAYSSLGAYAKAQGMSKEATEDLVKQVESWGDALGAFVQPLGAYTDLLGRKTEAEQKNAQSEADAQNKGVDEVIKAVSRDYDARLDALRKRKGVSDEAIQALEDERDAELGSLQGRKKGYEDFTDVVSVSVQEYLGELQTQVKAQETHADNMLRLAGRVSQGTLDELARMGPEGAPLVAELVKASDTELAKLDDLFSRRTKDATGAMAAELFLANTLLPQIAAKVGTNTATALATALANGTTTVAQIAKDYAWALAGGINPLLTAVGKHEVNRTDLARDNALASRNPARRAEGGPVWGAGTATSDSIPAYLSNGEYVIRADSVSKYGQGFLDDLNAGRFAIGGMVRHFAAGGFTSVAAVPKRPSTAPYGPPISTAAAATMDLGYAAAVQTVNALTAQATSAAGGVGGLAGSTKGLNPEFLSRFNTYNAALGNILRIGSGFRSRAQQQVLYNRWINHVPGQAKAAKPGSSNHERGLAIDHTPHSTAKMRAIAGTKGLRYPMSFEPWHVEPANISRRASGGAVRRFAAGGAVSAPRPTAPSDSRSATQARQAATALAEHNRQLAENIRLQKAAASVTDARKDLAAAKSTKQRAAAQVQLNRALANQKAVTKDISGDRALRGAKVTAKQMEDAAKAAKKRAEEAAKRAKLAAQLAKDVAAERIELEDNMYQVGRMSAAKYLALLDKRIKGERRYTNEWTSLVTERRRILKEQADARTEAAEAKADATAKAAQLRADAAEKARDAAEEAAQKRADAIEKAGDARDAALNDLNQLLDAERDVRAKMVGVEQDYADKVLDIRDRMARSQTDFQAASAAASADLQRSQQALLDTRRQQLESWARLDETVGVAWGNSVDQLLTNARSQAAQFEEWMASLADARSRGVSEQVIGALGLDEGPQALGQLRAFGQATTAEIDALNAEVARRTDLAGMQTSREQQNRLGDLGRDLVQAQEEYVETLSDLHQRFTEDQAALDDELVQAQAELLVRQAELATELAAIGQEQGRSYGAAMAEGMRSQIPAILAAAQALAAAQQGAASAATASYAAPMASAKASVQNGRYVDNASGRLAYYGPNGEPGYAAAQRPAGSLANRMPDGRTAYYLPVRTFDSGGFLEPGRFTLAYNGTSTRERVITPQQEAALRGGGGVTIVINGPVFGVDHLHQQIRTGAQEVLVQQRSAVEVGGSRG